jgi:hypothetical protein
MSEQIKPGTFQKGELHPGYGKERSEETRNKIGESNSSEIIFDGVFYKNFKEASLILGLTEKSIISKLHREEDKGNDRYKRLNRRTLSEKFITKTKPILFENIEYKSIKDASIAIGKTDTRVRQIMKEKTSKGIEGYKYL